MKKLFSRRGVTRHEKGGRAITALAIAFFICVNLMLVALNDAFRWHFLITDKQLYTLNGSTDEYFEKINPENNPVNFYFCMNESSLSENVTYERILDTVRQFADRYSFFSYSHLDIYYDHDFIKKDLGVQEAVTKDSVILYSPGAGYEVRSLSTFYIYDTEDTKNDDMIFNGEEIVATLVFRVLNESFPKVYFTVGHGESSTQSMQNLLFSAGYDVLTADLSQNDIEEDCKLIVIANPLYDFEEFKDGSASEITRLRGFIERGGSVLVLRSPAAAALPRLDALCESYGLSVKSGSILRDEEHSIASNSAALLLDYASSDAAKAVSDRADKAEGTNGIACAGVTAVTTKDGEGYQTSALLKTYESAALYTDGKKVSDGEHTVAALSRANGIGGKTGTLILVGSTGLGDAMLLDMGGYGNESFLYSLLEYAGGADTTPIGAGVVVLNSYPLTNLSSSTSRLFFVLLTVALPFAASVGGFLVCRRRKHR